MSNTTPLAPQVNFTSNIYNQVNYNYYRASYGLRFLNYIIDSLIVYALLFILATIISILNPEIIDGISDLVSRLILIVFYAVIMFFTEAMFNGKSIGKLITRTRAINSDGSDMDFGKAFNRNMIRMVPFDSLIALRNPCRPLHDTWSDTIVVDEKKLALHKEQAELFGSFKNQTQ